VRVIAGSLTMAESVRQKITLAEMRAFGVRGLLIYCSDYHCSFFQFPLVQKRAPDDAGAQVFGD
jgi:hypothetical protein